MEKINMESYNRITQSFIIKMFSGKAIFGKFLIIINLFSVLVSWDKNHSIPWAIFHYIFGFWNLFYNLLTGHFANGGFMDIVNSYI